MKFSILLAFAMVSVGLAAIVSANPVENQSPVVKVQLFYGAFCCYCHRFVNEFLTPIIHKLGQYIKFIPTAHFFLNGTSSNEVDAYVQKMELCAFDSLEFRQAFEYFHCNMNSTDPDPIKTVQNCSKEVEVDFQALDSCAKGDRGMQLALASAQSINDANVRGYPTVFVEDKDVYPYKLWNYLCENELKMVPECQKQKKMQKQCLIPK